MFILKILSSFLKDYKYTIIAYIMFSILAFPLEAIIIPQIYSNFFNILNKKTNLDIFIKYFLIIITFLFIINVSELITSYIESYLIPKFNEYIINYIFKYLLLKYEDSIKDIEIGKIITKISIIPNNLKEFLTNFFIYIFPRALAMLLINIYFFYLNWKLGLISFILVIIYFYINYFYFDSCSISANEKHILLEKQNEYMQDKLSNSYSIYSCGNLNKEIKDYELKTSIYTNKFKDNLKCIFKSSFISNVMMNTIFISLNIISTYLYLNKSISLTNLIAIFITIIYYIPCLSAINGTMPTFIQTYGSLKTADDFLEDLYNISLKKDFEIKKQFLKINDGSIIINNLTFGYKPGEYLFKNFFLNIKSNEKIAILGKSGNGKSSLIKLIMGYYKIPDNIILIDKININEFNLNNLREQISYVNQNTKLFNMSILENIQYGNNFKRDEIISILRDMKIDNIFKNLKNGLDTNVGIEGNNISGGQRQVIHILRSIFKNNKIIILDEPTSAIDKDNKDNIINAIYKLTFNKTLILITHDNEILRIVDRIIIIDAGKIIDDKYIKK